MRVLARWERACGLAPAALFVGCATAGQGSYDVMRGDVDRAGFADQRAQAEDDRALQGAELTRATYVRVVLHRNPSIESARQGWRAAVALLPKTATRNRAPMASAELAVGVPKHATLRCEHVLCGRCPKKHGSYWYAYWRDRDGRVRKRYIGKKLPPELRVRLRCAVAKPKPAKRVAAPRRRQRNHSRPSSRRREHALTPARKRTRVRRNE